MAKDPNKQKTEGKKDQVKGKVKEAVGALTDDREQKAEGKKDKAKGKAKENVAETRKKARENI